MRWRTIGMVYCWFAASFSYYGLSLNSGNLGGSLLLNFGLSSVVELPSYAMAVVMLGRLGRRATLALGFGVGGVGCVACLALPPGAPTVLAATVGKFCDRRLWQRLRLRGRTLPDRAAICRRGHVLDGCACGRRRSTTSGCPRCHCQLAAALRFWRVLDPRQCDHCFRHAGDARNATRGDARGQRALQQWAGTLEGARAMRPRPRRCSKDTSCTGGSESWCDFVFGHPKERYDVGYWLASCVPRHSRLYLGSMLRAMSDTASGAENDVSCTE